MYYVSTKRNAAPSPQKLNQTEISKNKKQYGLKTKHNIGKSNAEPINKLRRIVKKMMNMMINYKMYC